MGIEFSDHARAMLRERNIDEALVIEAVQSPDATSESYRNRKLYQKKVLGQILEVVTIQESGKIVVVTQYFLENLWKSITIKKMMPCM